MEKEFTECWNRVLTGVAQSVGRQPSQRKVTVLIPSQGTCPGCGPVPSRGECERQPMDVSLTHGCFPLSLSPSLPLSLKIKNKILKKTQPRTGKHLKYNLVKSTHFTDGEMETWKQTGPVPPVRHGVLLGSEMGFGVTWSGFSLANRAGFQSGFSVRVAASQPLGSL